MLASGLPRWPKGVRVQLRLKEFCTSAERLAWAKASGCPWYDSLGAARRSGSLNPCALAAGGGLLEVLQWAREHLCAWNAATCAHAAEGGHLEELQWAREKGCQWDAKTCARAAAGGHLDLLRWAREHDCPWNKGDCECVSQEHPETLAWVRQQPT